MRQANLNHQVQVYRCGRWAYVSGHLSEEAAYKALKRLQKGIGDELRVSSRNDADFLDVPDHRTLGMGR